MMQTIMIFFGYVKVPKAAVFLSVEQESFFMSLIKACKSDKNREGLEVLLEAQKTMTNFLRSGRF